METIHDARSSRYIHERDGISSLVADRSTTSIRQTAEAKRNSASGPGLTRRPALTGFRALASRMERPLALRRLAVQEETRLQLDGLSHANAVAVDTYTMIESEACSSCSIE